MNFASEKGDANKFEIFLLIFITLQPIIDVLTTISLEFFSDAATFGVFLRFLVMFACIIYIILYQMKNRKSKILIYLDRFSNCSCHQFCHKLLYKRFIHIDG